jgi:nucleotide-binding universal stress UspA family protein
MSYATLMVYVDAEDGRTEVVRLACLLAEKFNARLVGVSAIPIRPPSVANGVVVDTVTETEIDQIRLKLAAKEEWFQGIVAANRRTAEWRSGIDHPTDALTAEARGADLIIAAPGSNLLSTYNSLDPGGTVLRAGRPVLFVPEKAASLRGDRVVVGWKDTREARRALHDALPFLHEASRVTIAEVCDPGREDEARQQIDDVARYLAHHRINAGPKVILHREGSVAAQLIRLAEEEAADLLVTGAYGHSRLGEWIFGGVTRDLLASSPICCLMSH